MKSFIVTKLLFGIILISSVSYVNIPLKRDSIESKECLKVNGLVLGEDNNSIDSVKVTLFEKNEEMEWKKIAIVPYHDHNFTFTMDVNKYYYLEVSKFGFAKRFVVISTNLPPNVNVKPMFEYWFEVELFKEKKGADDYLNYPINLIGYNTNTEVFEDNHSFTMPIKTMFEESGQQVKIKDTVTKK